MRWLCTASILVCIAPAFAQDARQPEELAVVEVGAAPSRNLKDHNSSIGPTLAVEFTPIEKWLEIEAGVTPSFRRHSSAEWSVDLLFKKPWTLSRTFEFMAGAGPEWAAGSVAGEAVADFMFWPARWKHKWGWYLEPGYEYSFGPGHEQSIGISFGLLFAIRK